MEVDDLQASNHTQLQQHHLLLLAHENAMSPTPSPQHSTPLHDDQALDLDQHLNFLPEDLYTDPLLGYELSTKFWAIRDHFSEVQYSPASQKLFIFSFHLEELHGSLLGEKYNSGHHTSHHFANGYTRNVTNTIRPLGSIPNHGGEHQEYPPNVTSSMEL